MRKKQQSSKSSRCALILLLLVFGARYASEQAKAANVSPFKENNYLGVKIDHIEYDPQLVDNKISSGIPININVRSILLKYRGNDEIVVFQITNKISAIYDLWPEEYKLEVKTPQQQESAGATTISTFKKKEEILDRIKNIRLANLIPLSFFNPGEKYQIKVILNLNQIQKDEVAKLKKVVFENSVVSNDTTVLAKSDNRITSTSSSTGPRFKKLFNKILEQNINNEDEISEWKMEEKSPQFLLGEVK